MKKLKLNLDSKEMLSKEQMKKVSGGYWVECECHYSDTGAIYGDTWIDCQYVSDCVSSCKAYCDSV